MNFLLLLSAGAAIATAFGHSWLGEAKVLGPLYKERANEGVLAPIDTRRILRAVWHLPSFFWALTGFITLGFVLYGVSPPMWFVVFAAILYGGSALGNLWGLRRLHLGNVLLSAAAISLALGAVWD